MSKIRIILYLTALMCLTTQALAVEPGWLESFTISQPTIRQNHLSHDSPAESSSYLPKLYSGYGGVQIAQTKDYEKILMPNGTYIIRPKNTDFHE